MNPRVRRTRNSRIRSRQSSANSLFSKAATVRSPALCRRLNSTIPMEADQPLGAEAQVLILIHEEGES